MTLLRSIAFNLAFYLWTAGLAVGGFWLLLAPRRWTVAAMALWARGVNLLLRALAGVRVEVQGLEHVPPGACIVAAKHQSAWDTVAFAALVDDPAIVMKRELLWIPVYGWHSLHVGHIPVERSAGAAALRKMLRAAERAKAQGRPILIFPQGTRVAVGAKHPYQPGVAALYRALDVPVVPVALNSGLVWPRRTFLRHPGTITVRFLAPLPPGQKRDAFMATLEERIETASAALV